ncbi:MAG: hypothetical protein ACFB3T_04880 [Geminicoccaceae bacterium]
MATKRRRETIYDFADDIFLRCLTELAITAGFKDEINAQKSADSNLPDVVAFTWAVMIEALDVETLSQGIIDGLLRTCLNKKIKEGDPLEIDYVPIETELRAPFFSLPEDESPDTQGTLD